MPLPGKLTIGFLQEDNPQKSFFRFKPLFVKEDQRYRMIEETVNLYPEDGYIRIVPDKNEINQFKTRMRQTGVLCMMDLRKYPYENNKIRPNKNYSKGGAENNAFIVYSDVICATTLSTIIEVIDAPEELHEDRCTLTGREPLTRAVAVRVGDRMCGPFSWNCVEGEEGRIQLMPMEGNGVFELTGEALGERLLSAECEAGDVRNFVCDACEIGMLDENAENGSLQAGVSNDIPPVAPPKSADPLPKPASKSAPHGEKVDKEPQESIRETEPKPTDKPEPAVEAQEEKPWLHRDESIMPRALGARLSLREQAIQAQSGINPRRGRSLSEVVDEQWRKSRIDQLGHPVLVNTTAKPVISPIEFAITALKDAWRYKDARAGLIAGVVGESEISAAIRACFAVNADGDVASALEESLNEMEAARLQLAAEIDALREKRASVRAALMVELKLENKRELAEFEEKKSSLQDEITRNKQAAQDAQKAAEEANQLFERILDTRFDEKILEHVAGSRALDLLQHMLMEKKQPEPIAPPRYNPEASQLFDDVRIGFEKAGYALSTEEAVNLLAALTLDDMVILSGEPGAGKGERIKTLAAVLGLDTPGTSRFVRVRAEVGEEAKKLMDAGDDETLSLVMIDSLNVSDTDKPIEQAMEALEQSIGSSVHIMATVQDAPDGRPLPARLLERSFFIRLDMPEPSEGWKPRRRQKPAPQCAVSRDALLLAFAENEELPAEVEMRMTSLRAALQEIGWVMSRKTLDSLWRYCAAVMPHMPLSPLEVLDMALAQRALPAMLAAMELDALYALKGIFSDMPRCLKLMDQRLPLPPL